MRLLHALCKILMVFALTLGTATAMPVRADHSLTQMVICGENGAKTVWLDASGTPAEPGHDCEECPKCIVFHSVAVTFPQKARPWVAPRRIRTPIRSTEALPRQRAHLRPALRGPPCVAISQKGNKASPLTLHRISRDILEFCQGRGCRFLPDNGRSVEDARR